MTRFQLILPVPDHDVTKNMTGLRSHVEGPQMYQINSQTNSFQNMCDMLKITIDRLARKIDSLQKEHLRIAYFCVHESGLPDFGRTWMPNGWHQVYFWGAPESFGVRRFKLAMWKVGGTRARYIVLVCVHKSDIPNFGRTWTANSWHQVNFRPTPENFGVWRF